MKYAKFPYEKIEKKSRVVLYGAGRVGRSMYEQNKIESHCEIAGIVDGNADNWGKSVWGVIISSPDCLAELPYDYILVSVSDETFGSVYDGLAEKESYKDRLIAIDIDEKPQLEHFDVAVDDTFHAFISDGANWDKTIKDYRGYWLGKGDRANWIYENRPAAELLLRGYEYGNPVFHVIDERDAYKGSISKEAIRSLSAICAEGIGARQTHE